MVCTVLWMLILRCSAPINIAELRAFLCLFCMIVGPTTADVDNKRNH